MTSPKSIAALALIAVTFTPGMPPANAQGPPTWPPVPPEELALKDNVFDPGTPALILEYEVQTDNAKSTETTYKRIKVFREEGKKFADLEIRYFEKLTRVEEIHARVTSPTGKSEDFNGVIYDKEVVRVKKYRFNAKTFTLPNVEIGSVIEYSYRLHWHSDIPDAIKNPGRYFINEAFAYPAAEWEIQQDLAVRHARFTLHPVKGAHTVMFSRALPKDAEKRALPDGSTELEVNYIPAFQKEEYSPPEESLKVRADVFYTLGMYGDSSFYWLSLARREAEYYDAFIGKPKSLQKEAERLLSPGDSDETKLRKIYARVQQIRALSYEPEKSKKERKQESLKENKNAEEVLNRGYAFNNEINLVFIALARAAGFRAYAVRLAARNRAFFAPERLDSNQLNSLVVEVVIGSTPRFFDPATVYCPDGFLPWEETDAGGIRIDRADNKIETTPPPQSKDAVIRRQAELNLDAEGNLDGKLSITYEGQEALRRRLKAIDQDEVQRQKDLEDEVQHSLPQGVTVKLLSADAWVASQTPLRTQFQIQVPNYANKAGQRLLLPVAVFHANGQNPFTSPRRTHPVYFEYPAEVYDDVTLVLPPGVRIESLPANGKFERGATFYESSAEKQGNTLRLKRTFKMAAYYVPPDRYQALRQFYEQVRAGDEQQAILKSLQPQDKQ
jgi:transglutaminase-like putative cysteine protease